MEGMAALPHLDGHILTSSLMEISLDISSNPSTFDRTMPELGNGGGGGGTFDLDAGM